MGRNLDCDVLIVGAGPVGLIAAMDLAQRGVEVIVVDERLAPDPLTVRCNHISSRSMEIFRKLGFADEVRAAGFHDDFPHDVSFRTWVTGQEFARIRIPGRKGRMTGEEGPDTWWPTAEPPHRLNQIFLEPIMIAHAQRTPGLRLIFDRRFLEFTELNDGLRAHLVSQDGTVHRFDARYLIGCDGGGSSVRKAIGARLEGDAVVQRVQSTYIHAPGLTDAMQCNPCWAIINLNPTRSGTLYAIDNDDRFLVHNYLRPDETEFEAVDRDAAIRTILGVDDEFRYEILRLEDWIGRRLVADRLRSGRVFLAGDAAHIWVPYAGYGMNAGIADAFDLSWLLAARICGWGGRGMLDAYEAERHPITSQVSHFAMSHAEKMIRNRGAVPAEIADESPEGDAARVRFGRLCYDTNVAQYCCAGLNFGYFYDRSPIIAYDGEAAPPYTMDGYTPSTVPGCRAPHVFLDDGTSLYDHLGHGYTLLHVGQGADVACLAAAADAMGIPLTVLPMHSCEEHDKPLILVRPDQHIAWRGQTAPADPVSLFRLLGGHTEA